MKLTSPPPATGPTGSLQLTGHLGDVMKESCHISHTVAKALLGEIEPSNKCLINGHVHIHVPEVSGALLVMGRGLVVWGVGWFCECLMLNKINTELIYLYLQHTHTN